MDKKTSLHWFMYGFAVFQMIVAALIVKLVRTYRDEMPNSLAIVLIIVAMVLVILAPTCAVVYTRKTLSQRKKS